MKQKIVISDTNIFIDLVDANLIDEFFKLPFEIHTTTFILKELLKADDRESVQKHVDAGDLHSFSFEGKDFMDLLTMYNNAGSNLSVNDCSVWLLASKKEGALLTGDRNLRNKAKQSGIEVHGLFYVLDKLVECGIISTTKAHAALVVLKANNNRLPRTEIEKRLEMWK